MPSNPMQKKARNSFILGAIVALIVCALIGVVLYLLILNPNRATKDKGKPVTAYVLNQDVKSGQVVTPDLLTPITVYENMVPRNFVDPSFVANMKLQDKDGHYVATGKEGLYISIDNQKYSVEKENGYYYVNKGGEKEILDQMPVIAKVSMGQNTVLTTSLLAKSENETADDTRYVEYNMLTLATRVSVGDFVDLRITFPNGQDLIIVSKKEVKSIVGGTVGFQMTEAEINMMESAIVEAYIMKASKLYIAQYTNPGIQKAASKTYVPTTAVQELIKGNPNITQQAIDNLYWYSNASVGAALRSYEQHEIDLIEEETRTENISEGIKQEIEDARLARESYLAGLQSY